MKLARGIIRGPSRAASSTLPPPVSHVGSSPWATARRFASGELRLRWIDVRLSGVSFGETSGDWCTDMWWHLAACNQREARADLVTLDISYSGSNLGVSGTGVVQGISVGNGEYDLVSGYINAVLPGVGTVYETLVTNPNAPNFAATAVFENSNGDEFVYDDRVFVPYNSPASPDGAQLTYAGGLVFQTATPSNEDVYLSANTARLV